MRARSNIYILWVLILCSSTALHGQDLGLIVNTISGAQGLRGTGVLTSLVDSKSQLWIGTDSGLNMMEGNRAVPVELGRDLILVGALCENPSGTIWIGHSRGLGRLREGVYEEIELPRRGEDQTQEYRVVAIEPLGEGVLVGCHQGLLAVRGDGSSRTINAEVEKPWQMSASVVFSIYKSQHYGLLVGTAAGTFVLKDDDKLEFLCRIGNLHRPFEDRSTWAMIDLGDGALLMGSRLGSFRYDPKTESVEPFDTSIPAGAAALVSVDYYRAKNGSIWAVSPWGKITNWDPESHRISSFRFAPMEGTAPINLVSTFKISRSADGLVWICTLNGLYFFEDVGPPPTLYFPEDRNKDLRRHVFDAVELEGGSFLLATGADGLQFLGPEFQPLPIDSKGLEDQGVGKLHGRDGTFYFLNSSEQIISFDGRSLSLVIDRDDLRKHVGNCEQILPRRKGGILVAGSTGLWEFDEKGSPQELTFSGGRPFGGPFAIEPDGLSEDSRGDLWIKTKAALIRITPESKSFRYGSTRSVDLDLAIGGDRIQQIEELKPGVQLIVVAGRLGVLDTDKAEYHEITLKTANKRDLGFIRKILRSEGRFWATIASTLVLLDLDTNTVQNCPVQFSSTEFILLEIFAGREGRILAADGDGLNLLDSKTALRVRVPPPPFLKSVEVLGNPVALKVWETFQELPEDHNRITFELRPANRISIDQTRFALRLQGVDDDWQEVGTQGRINYAGLAPGDYLLEARAVQESGVWSVPTTLAKFRILTPVWKTIPFQISVGMFCGLLLVLGFRRQVGLGRRRAEALENVVADRTESLRTKSEELERLYNVVKNINIASNIEELMHTTLAESIAMLHADAGRFYVKTDDVWQLAVVVGWLPASSPALSSGLVSRLRLASPTRPIEQLVDTPEDVRDEQGKRRESCSLMMHLDDEGSLAACMILDYWERLNPANALKLNLVERLYQPVLLAYRKLRLIETAERLNNLKNELLGAAAHDLRSPLTVIGMTAEMMKSEVMQQPTEPDSILREIDMIKTATQRMAAMVDKLLDISAIESGRVEVDLLEIDLRRVIRDRVEFFAKLAESRAISLRLSGDPVELPVHADSERIGTALDNLLSNALKYTPSGGDVLVSYSRNAGEVVVEVVDDGQGLPPEDSKDLFNTFRKMSAKPAHNELSSGLGLAIVKRIVDLHGGRVFARSELRIGSTFGFALPLRRETAIL